MRIKRASLAARTAADGTVFDSASERRRWDELRLLERAGEISQLRRQVKFPLVIDRRPVRIRSERYPNGRACGYKADFVYIEKGNLDPTVEDHKGIATKDARLRIAVVEAIYGFRVLITGSAARGKNARSQ